MLSAYAAASSEAEMAAIYSYKSRNNITYQSPRVLAGRELSDEKPAIPEVVQGVRRTLQNPLMKNLGRMISSKSMSSGMDGLDSFSSHASRSSSRETTPGQRRL